MRVGVKGAAQGRRSGHQQVIFEPRLGRGEGVSPGQVSGGISELGQGLIYSTTLAETLGELTNLTVPQSPTL